jgi:hypothetical protein
VNEKAAQGGAALAGRAHCRTTPPRQLQLLGEGLLTDAALQTINGHHDGGPLKHFHEAV